MHMHLYARIPARHWSALAKPGFASNACIKQSSSGEQIELILSSLHFNGSILANTHEPNAPLRDAAKTH